MTEVIAVWFAANLLTGLSYVHIAFEMGRWSRATKAIQFSHFLTPWMLFILTCGLHHFNMLRHAQHHSDPWLLLSDVPMALVSVFTSLVIVNLRPNIVGFLKRSFKTQAQAEKLIQPIEE